MQEKMELGKNEVAQKLLFEGCRELNYLKVFLAIEEGANVNQNAPFQTPNEKTAQQTSYDIDIFNHEGCTFSPLSLLAMHGNKKIAAAFGSDDKACEIAKLLLENGAEIDVNDTGDMGNTPLHWALVTFKTNLAKLFIEHAITHQKNVINMPNRPAKFHYGANPPLIMALKAGSQYLAHNICNLELAELLIAAGADVNAMDHQQQTALHWAAILRCPAEFFNLLVEKGAQYQRNLFGKSPKYLYETPIKESMININYSTAFSELGFHLFDWNQNDLLRELERDRALRMRNSVYQQEVLELLELFDISLNESANAIDITTINKQDDWGRTRLHRAVFYGNTKEFEKLLELGADITVQDNLGLTALGLAQYLQEKLTYKVSPEFFEGRETFIKAANCTLWKRYEEKLLEFSSLNEIETKISEISFSA